MNPNNRKSPQTGGKRHYWLIAMILLVIAVVFLMRRAGEDPYEIKDLERNPADLVFTKHARCRMDCRSITEDEVKQILVKGEVNYSKSEPKGRPDPKYALEGTSSDGQKLRIVFAADDGKVVVVTAIDLGKEWPCNCE
jgi:LPXTG-motif cell wall-anchored protein